jgi:hypothetical protein
MSEDDLDRILRRKFDPALGILMSEEAGREIGQRLAERLPKPTRPTTRTLDKKDEIVSYVYDAIRSNVAGRLVELVVRSPHPDFSLLLAVDGTVILSRTFNELVAMSPHSDILDVFQDIETGVYVAVINNIRWRSEFLAQVYVDYATRLHSLWAIWEEYS